MRLMELAADSNYVDPRREPEAGGGEHPGVIPRRERYFAEEYFS